MLELKQCRDIAVIIRLIDSVIVAQLLLMLSLTQIILVRKCLWTVLT
jgi:hypothetical protein